MASNMNKTNVGGVKTSSRSLNNLLASAYKQFAEAINLLSGDRVVFGDAVTAISTERDPEASRRPLSRHTP